MILSCATVAAVYASVARMGVRPAWFEPSSCFIFSMIVKYAACAGMQALNIVCTPRYKRIKPPRATMSLLACIDEVFVGVQVAHC